MTDLSHDLIVTVAWSIIAVCGIQAILVYGITRLFLHGPLFRAKAQPKDHVYEPVRGDFGSGR